MTAKLGKPKQTPVGGEPEALSKVEREKTVTKPRRPKPAVTKAATVPVVTPANTVSKPSSEISVESDKGKHEVKHKLVRDSFKFPQQEYIAFHALKARCLKSGLVVKKSELVRAGLIGLLNLTDKQLVEVISSLEKLKTGRPAK